MRERSERGARRGGLRRPAGRLRGLASCVLAALVALPAPVVLAEPRGGVTVAGEATIQYGVGRVDTPRAGVKQVSVGLTTPSGLTTEVVALVAER